MGLTAYNRMRREDEAANAQAKPKEQTKPKEQAKKDNKRKEG